MKNLFNTLFALVGLGGFLLGLAILTSNYAKAATTTYAETLTVSKWHNVQIKTPALSSDWLTLGPAAWSVTGSQGNNSFTETWTVPGWNSSIANNPAIVATVFADSATKYDSPVTLVTEEGNFGIKSGYRLWTTGLYGGLINAFASNIIVPDLEQSFHSWPNKWEISGTLTTP